MVRVARNSGPGVTIEQIAKDFGVHPMTLQKWMRRADIDDGAEPGQSRTEAAEIRELRKRNRLLEQENEVLRPAEYRANALFDAHKDDPEFGHRLLADEARDAGEAMADRTALRIASSNGLFSVFGKPNRGKGRRPGPPVHDDLCTVVDEDGRARHVFAADVPNELWLTDITEHKTAEGQALRLRDQGRVQRPHRGVLDRLH